MPVTSSPTATARGEQIERPFSGTSVVLLGAASAYAGRLLAGLGATVVLVEPPGGCPERRTSPFAPGPLTDRSSLAFRFNSAGLRSVVIDASRRDGKAILERALGVADICIDSLRWLAEAPWTSGAREALLAAGETAVCRVGPTGRLANIGADDMLVQAAGGLMFVTGFPEGEPTPGVCELGQTQSALVAAVATTSLLQADSPQSHMEVGAQAAVSLTTLQTSNPGFYTWNGVVPRRGGLAGTGGPPIRCSDGWAIFTPPPERWGAFVDWLRTEGLDTTGIPESLEGLGSLREILPLVFQRTAELSSRHTKHDFYHAAQQRGLLCMPVNSLDDLFRDEHLGARRFFVSDADGAMELVAPFRSEPAMWELPSEAPRLGEYTEEFLTSSLGLSREEIEALVGMGSVACCH